MPDRHLRERDRALPQRLGRLENNLRDLAQRASVGALRTAKAATSAPNTFYTYVQAVSVTVPSGRWAVYAEVTFVIAAAAGTEDLYLTINLLDPSSGLPTGSSVITPRHCQPAATVGAPLRVAVALVDDFSADNNVMVSLATRNANGGGYTLATPRLLVLPV